MSAITRHGSNLNVHQQRNEYGFGTYIVEYYSAIKKNEIMPFAITWMDMEIILLSKTRQTKIGII